MLAALRGLVAQRTLNADRLSGASHLWDEALAAIAKAAPPSPTPPHGEEG
jgi:hypothetical protein